MKKILLILFVLLMPLSCHKEDHSELINRIETGVFHDTWGTAKDQHSISWEVTPINVDQVRNDIMYINVVDNSEYKEYNLDEVMDNGDFISFLRSIRNKNHDDGIVQINDSIKCTWKLFCTIYNTYIR